MNPSRAGLHQRFTRRVQYSESRPIELEDGMDLGCMVVCAAVITTLLLLAVWAHAAVSSGL